MEVEDTTLTLTGVELVVGLQQVLTFKGVTRVAVVDPAVCEVKWLGTEELLLLPQRAGRTTLQVWSGQTAARCSSAPRPERLAQILRAGAA